jgi:hypothetical protein
MKAPAYVAIPGKDCFALEDDYSFKVGDLEIWIPAGFSWNGASIPQALWSELGGRFEPDSMRASLEHDWLYLFHATDRTTADKHFHDRCREDGMSMLKAETLYEALRAFGGTHWPTSDEDRKQIAEIKEMLSIREDKDKFLASMVAE